MLFWGNSDGVFSDCFGEFMKTKRKYKTGDIVYIEWEDHCSSNSSWTAIDKDECFNICMIKTCGHVVKDGDSYIKVALMMQIENQTYSECINIIKSCITKIKKIQIN